MTLRHVCAAVLACALVAGCATTAVTERDASPGLSTYGAPLGTPMVPGPAVAQSQQAPLSTPPVGGGGAGVSTADLAAAGIGVGSGARPGVPAAGALGPDPAATLPSASNAAASPIQRAGFDAPATQGAVAQTAPASAAPTAAPIGAVSAPAASAVPQHPLSQPSYTAPSTRGTDIAAYALGTEHSVGQSRYRRFLGSEGRAARLCRRYPGADLAQRAFLESGGPERDKLGLDPDGDGFACNWSPEPFRAARG